MSSRFSLLLYGLLTLAAPAVSADTLEDLAAGQSLRLGIRLDAAPFSFLDSKGEASGYSVQLCQQIAKSLQAELGLAELPIEYVPVDTENRFAKLESGEIDIECASTTHTLARESMADFSLHILATGAALMVPANAELEGLAALTGQSISVVRNTTSAQFLSNLLNAEQMTATLVEADDYTAALADLESGEVAAILADRALLVAAQKAAIDPAALKVLHELYTYEPLALVLQKSDEPLRIAVDRTLSELYASGAIADIYSAWFGDFYSDPAAEAFFQNQIVPLE